METYTQKFKIRLGLFVIGGIALFVFAIFIIGKQKNLFNPVFMLTSTFYNVSGLQVGNNIRFSGITVGTVDDIRIINDSTVRVDMMIQKDIRKFIKSDSKVAIGSEGLIGDRLLVISQGSTDAPVVKDGQQLVSKEPVETDAIMVSVQRTAGSVEIISKQLAEIMLKVNSGQGTLGRFIHDTIIAENLNQTILDLKKTSRGLGETMDSTQDNISSIMKSFKVTAGNTEVFSKQLGETMVHINSGTGTVGRLIQDTTIAADLSQIMINLQKSSRGLEENMEALKHNFLLRGYFKRKAREALKMEKDSIENNSQTKRYR